MSGKIALITGITGQDGSYLARLLLEKGYVVHGIKRRSSLFNTNRVDDIYEGPHTRERRFFLHYGDVTDSTNLIRIVQNVQPDEIYNLAAQSHVAVSFESPEYTADVTAMGTLRLLEAVRILKLEGKTRFYQASTSELYGLVQEVPQTEKTPFYPRSPYAVAKLYSYWITVNYREAYGMYACNGILFNHESPVRGETFVTRKITRAVARIVLGIDECLYLGNLGALRDWGHARDYVRMQWLMLQQDEPEDYVIASGEQHSVREFCEKSFEAYGIRLTWRGEGLEEHAVVAAVSPDNPLLATVGLQDAARDGNAPSTPSIPLVSVGDTVVRVDPRYFRPTEVESLIGDAGKARSKLGWEPEISFPDMVQEMVREDLKLACRDYLCRQHGYYVCRGHE